MLWKPLRVASWKSTRGVSVDVLGLSYTRPRARLTPHTRGWLSSATQRLTICELWCIVDHCSLEPLQAGETSTATWITAW